jgi:phosphate starvation-inducible protein PhoH
VHLTGRDVVRHRIVQDIVDAYARHDPGDAGTAARGPR